MTDNYMVPSLADYQWRVASHQMKELKNGQVHPLFKAFGELLALIEPEHCGTSPGLSLLDVGCGCGYYSEIIEYYRPGVFEYQGCDYNPGMIAKAKKLWPGRSFVQQDARTLQYSDRSFDVVMSGACIAHIEQWKQALGEICRVSKQWLILHRNPIQPNNEMTTLKTRLYDGLQVWTRRFNRTELLDFVRCQGFCLIHAVKAGTSLESYLYKRTADD